MTPLVEAGYAFVTFDQEGHGLSDGMHILVEDRNNLMKDAHQCFEEALAQFPPSTPRFLCGESMGGAVALMLHLDYGIQWTGAVLLAPMVKIVEKMKPPAIAEFILRRLVHVIPTWPVVPSKSLTDVRIATIYTLFPRFLFCYVMHHFTIPI